MLKQFLFRPLRLNTIKRNFCSPSSTIDPNKKYPTISELFNKSLTCTQLEYKGKKIFLIADKPSDDYSVSRIEYTVKTLKPAVVCLEATNAFLGLDNNISNPKDARWRRPNPTGTLILDSYRTMYADDYPNLAPDLESYTPDKKGLHIMQLRELCDTNNIPINYCGEDIPTQLIQKSKSGQLEELTVQFREEFLREAKRSKERRDKAKGQTEAASMGRQSQSFFGAMEGLDEKEQKEQIELTKLVVEDLTNLANMFENDRLMNSEQFKDMMRECNNLKTIDDYELIADKSLVRNAVLNETIRALEFDYEAHAKDFWQAMKLLTVNRDRHLLRLLIEQSEEMLRNGDQGVILGVVHILHIYGIETMWKSSKFWKDEEISRQYVKDMADREWVKEGLEKENFPWFGKDDPARDTDINESTKF